MVMAKTVVVAAICLIGLVAMVAINTRYERTPVALAPAAQSAAPQPAAAKPAIPLPPVAAPAPNPAPPAVEIFEPQPPAARPQAASISPPRQNAIAEPSPAPTPAATPSSASARSPAVLATPPVLSQTQVSELQRALRDRGFTPGPVDGIWGPRTAGAVAEFKQAMGLPEGHPVDGAFVDDVKNR